jgi:membrane associated rhomboid family serine protease
MPLLEWFRFILPIFLHVGLVHLLFNMVAQLTIGAQVEREMGRYSEYFDSYRFPGSNFTAYFRIDRLPHHLLCGRYLRLYVS